MKTIALTDYIRKKMGIKLVKGEIVDKYGRILEVYTNDKGNEDLRPTGRVSR